MGNSKSKTSQVSGDPQVQVLNHLEVNEEHQVDHELKLTIILVVVLIQLIIMICKTYTKYSRKQALKAARSIAAIQNI